MKALMLALALLAPVESLDVQVRQLAQESRRPALEAPARLLSDRLGRPQITLGLLLGIAVFGGVAGVETARLAIFALVPVNLLVEGLKRTTDRARPDGEHDRNNASFPSSHSANVFALMTVFARRWRRWAWAFWSFATLMATSRIYLNRHWFSDVLVGSAIGLLCAWIVVDAWQRRVAAREAAAIPGRAP